jgi:hypothetical protein
MNPRSASIHLALLAALFLIACVSPARASGLRDVRGHLAVGYARLFIGHAPGGSFSVAGGVDHPITRDLRAGIGAGYHLLGSRTVERGSLVATVDYSLFEAVLFAHWSPPGLGPLGRISAGPALISARAELSTSGGGAAFSDLAVEDLAPGVAVDLTLMARSSAPVRVGLEIGGRLAFLDPEEWTMATARLAFHY